MYTKKKVEDLLNECMKVVDTLIASRYTCTRDKDSNLRIAFNDEKFATIPYIPFRPYQLDLQRKLFIDKIKRHLICRPRRSGKEYESWNLLCQAAIMEPGLYMMIYPTNVRARAILWEGAITLPDGTSVPFLNMIPDRLKETVNNQEMKIKLVNGSIIWVVGSDVDPNKLRGTNPRGIVYSEFAFQDPRVFYIMLPALRQNGGWLICQSTFDGMNHFWRMVQQNQHDPLWNVVVDSVKTLVDADGNRFITDDMIDEDRRAGMPEYLIQQEYYSTVEINQETKYFAKGLKNVYEEDRIISNLIIPNKNVYTAWDIGVNDCTAIVLFQLKRIQNYMSPHVIGYIEENNQDMTYYIEACRRFCARYNLPLVRHFLPHDGANRSTHTLKDSQMFLADLGEASTIVPRPTNKQTAIETMRRTIYITHFNKENTNRLIDCLSNYSKEYDDKKGIYKSNPVHDWSSHGVSAYQTMCLALEGKLVNDKPQDIVYYYQ